MEKELIIVGNGIDIKAGLSSKYEDYFRTRKIPVDLNDILIKTLKEYLNENSNEGNKDTKIIIPNLLKDFNKNVNDRSGALYNIHTMIGNLRNIYSFNFWEMSSITKRNFFESWQGIEDNIKSTLVNLFYLKADPKSKKEINHFICNIWSNIKKSIDEGIPMSIEICDDKLDTFMPYFVLLLFYLKENKGTSIPTLDEALMNELNKLERNFKEYLSIHANNTDYIKKSNLIYNELASKNRVSVVLSFNYTNPLGIGITDDTNSRDKCNIDNYYHVHGSLNGEIIFGIDDNYIENDTNVPEINKFTKTYRIMKEDNDLNIDIYDGIDVIKFYGHSLSKADNSYFQSIFDYCDIYNNMITLEFYYSNYGGENREGETKDLVYDLIERYGDTLDNKNKGKNLLHKMNIEGRIKVRELKTPIK